jgi:D-alanyl-D-alanine carboxypeptidase
MFVLFDQNTPVAIAKSLPGHVVKTARQQGWDTLATGELLRAAEEAGFNILLTADQNLAYQQNLKGRKIAIVILGGNRWSNVKKVMSRIVTAVDSVQPGACIVVDVPSS